MIEQQREPEHHVWRPWLTAWLGGSVLGVVNGTIRELIYKDSVGEKTAHYVSTATLVILLALYFSALDRRWPLPTKSEALSIGLTWVVLTASFDFGFGHYVDGKSWSQLARDYNITEGRIWILVLLFIGVGPALARTRRLRAARGATRLR